LLAHVRAKGLLWVPEPLGLDEVGREVLSFIPGQVPHDMPEWIWTEQVLTDVARALREWHDATADFSAPDGKWGLPPSSPREVICHNDFAPYNCIFDKGKFVGAIDFDMCAPGSRIWDLAYTAYRFVPLMPGPGTDDAIPGVKSPFGVLKMKERLELFLSGYGAVGGQTRFGCAELMGATIERLNAIAAWTEEFVRSHGNAALADHPALYRSHARWLGS
jgi:aminoglycoside phosphotransferase (APT) family kinase protein